LRFDLPNSWGFWRDRDLDFLDQCNEFWIFMLPGWNISVGIAAEISRAEARAMPTTYLSLSSARKIIEMAEERQRSIQ
jgi:hypothetical protein